MRSKLFVVSNEKCVFLISGCFLVDQKLLSREFLPASSPPHRRTFRNGPEKYRNNNYNLQLKCLLILRCVKQWKKEREIWGNLDKCFHPLQPDSEAGAEKYVLKREKTGKHSSVIFNVSEARNENEGKRKKIGKFRKPQSNNLHTSKCYLLISI